MRAVMQNKRKWESSWWETGIFVMVQSFLFAGFTRIIDSPQATGLQHALPIVGIALCLLFGVRCLLRGKSLWGLFFALVFAAIWFTGLPA